jgi:hypothetical protein
MRHLLCLRVIKASIAICLPERIDALLVKGESVVKWKLTSSPSCPDPSEMLDRTYN